MKATRRLAVRTGLLIGVAVSLAVAASVASGSAGRSSALPTSGEVVFFGISQQNPYVKQWNLGAAFQAKKYGWKLRYVESANSQQQQDTQITQLLSSGKKPIGIVLSPFAGKAAAASMLAIKRAKIPLVIIDAEPPADQSSLYDIYAGANDVLSAQTSAELIATEGYDVATQVVPAMKGKFNFVYTLNDAIGLGVIKALKENGLTPGKDVLVAGGTCLGKATNKAVVSGELAGTAVQSPFVEGRLTIVNLAQYLSNGNKVTPGRISVPANQPPSLKTPPHKYNYMPNPPVENSAAGFVQAKVWGQTAKQLCSYTG